MHTFYVERTSAALMVDYSCALRLTGAIAVLTAMSQSARAVIGSEHFVVQDEHVPIPEAAAMRIERTMDGLSTLYLAVDGTFCGAIGNEDPLRAGAVRALQDLRALGFKRLIMLTGDNEHAAARIAREAVIIEFCADLLPARKHEIVEQLQAESARVVMVGDGANDPPALSVANVGVAMGSGTAIAKEVADITLSEGDLFSLVVRRRLSQRLDSRMSPRSTGSS